MLTQVTWKVVHLVDSDSLPHTCFYTGPGDQALEVREREREGGGGGRKRERGGRMRERERERE